RLRLILGDYSRDLLGVAREICAEFVARKRLRRGASVRWRLSSSGLQSLLRRFNYGIGAICQALQGFAGASARALVALEGTVNALEDRFQRNVRFLPRLHDCPIQWGYQQMGAALL